MATARVRTVVVAGLAAAVAVRISASQPVGGVVADIARNPGGAITAADDGWTVAGTLGDASAQGLRDVPLALFAWLADLVGLSASGVQTGWRAGIFVLALVGAVRLAQQMSRHRAGAGAVQLTAEPWTPWVAAALYALGPALVATTVQSPVNGLAAAALPWLLAPLLRDATGWRPAASSAAWLGLAGFASPPWAVAAFVAGLVGAAPRRRQDLGQLLRWLVLALLASAWWLVALVWESSRATNVTSLSSTPMVGDALEAALASPTWSRAWLLVAVAGPVLVAVCMIVLRIPGRDRPVVAGLLLVATLVLVAVTAGGWDIPVLATSALGQPAATLAPVLAWTALAGLLAWTPVMNALRDRLPVAGRQTWSREHGVALGVGVALMLTSFVGLAFAAQEPAAPEGDNQDLWAYVEAWSEKAPPGRVLVLPAVAEGRTGPEVARALHSRPWVARDQLPLSEPEATNALDDVIWRLSRGQGDPGTANGLRRLGISYVLLRNDAPLEQDREQPVALVRQALQAQGAVRVALLGPGARTVAGGSSIVDFGLRDRRRNIEIWSIPSSSDGWVYAGEPITAAGDGALPSDLANAGLLGTTAVRLDAPTGRPDVLSDSARHRDVDQRVALDPFGPDLTEPQERSVVPPAAQPRATAVRQLRGAESVRASTSAADLASRPRQQDADPTAAVDGNVFTAWQARPGTGVGQWWEIDFGRPTNLSGASVQLVQNVFVGSIVSRVRLESDTGQTEVDVPAGGLVDLAAAGTTRLLRIQATGFEGAVGRSGTFGISEVSVPGLDVRDELAVDGASSTWVLAARPGSHANCVPPAPPRGDPRGPVPGAVVCDRGLSVEGPDTGTLNRVVQVAEPRTVAGRVWIRAADTEAMGMVADRLADPSVAANGSSVASQDLVVRPQAAADADPVTAWRPAPEDGQPALTLSWDKPAQVRGVRLQAAPDAVASRPLRVRVEAPSSSGNGQDPSARTTEVKVGAGGLVRIAPVRTRELTLTFVEDSRVASVDSVTGGVRKVPIAIAEVAVLGGPDVSYEADAIRPLGCGSGPMVRLGGRQVATSLRASSRDLTHGRVVQAGLCERPSLAEGTVRISVEASFSWRPLGLVLSPLDGPFGEIDQLDPSSSAGESPDSLPTGLLTPDTAARVVQVRRQDTEGTIALAVPAGKGWVARSGARELQPFTTDGWAQAWRLPPGVDEISIDYSADDSLRLGAGVSVLAWIGVLLLACLGSRRPAARRDQAMVGRSTQA
jgi:arabinofuranan 3-O-arabinosyltransferase